jgi:hypothetical protein
MPHSKGFASAERFESLGNLVCGRQVVFVVGLYKTGTSLATELCTHFGAVDVSRYSNSLESGVGTSRPRYLTRECKVLRKINEHRLPARRRRDAAPLSASALKTGSDRVVASYSEYLRACPAQVVLKDVRFIYCLNDWIEAARRSGKSAGILFTSRDVRSLTRAWDHAPYTRALLATRGIDRHTSWLHVQSEYARGIGIPTAALSLADAKLLRHALHETSTKE